MGVVSVALTAGYQNAGGQTRTSGATPKPRGTVVVAYPAFQTESFAPKQANISGRTYYAPIFDVLVGVKPNGAIDYSIGVLASVKSTDGIVYLLTLHPGMRWQDGTAITSDDLKFTLDMFRSDPGLSGGGTTLKNSVDRVEIVNRLTTRVVLKARDFLFPVILAPIESDLQLYPKAYIERVGLVEFDQKPMASGPWKFVSRVLGQKVEYVANTNYWNKKRIPGFARLRIVLAADATSRKAMLRTGAADLAPLDPVDVASFKQKGFRIISSKSSALVNLYFWRSWDPVFLTNKLLFRKALIRAINVTAIVKAFYPPGTARQATGPTFLSPASAGFNPKLPSYNYSVAAAKAALQQSGYQGQEVTLYSYVYPNVPEIPDLILAIAEDWKKIGVKVKIVSIDFGTFAALQTSRKFDPPAVSSIVPGQTRPSVVGNMRVFMLGPNDGGFVTAFANTEESKAEYAQVIGVQDPKARSALIKKFAAKWFQTYWSLPIAWRNGAWAVGPKVASWTPTDLTCCLASFETLKPK